MDRQTILQTNRSLRTIKNELETLLGKGIIDEAAFDTIHSSLPAESPLRAAIQTPARSSTPTSPPAQLPPSQSLHVSHGHQSPAPPPAYVDASAPKPPSRSAKPVIVYAHALWPYNEGNERDLAFEKNDIIAVYQKINDDWWLGRNQRTGHEGIFPSGFVDKERTKVSGPHQPTYGYPSVQGPSAQQNPYNSNVPPITVAEGGQYGQGPGGDSKAGEYGKKFGKKLGNAAIFGAGASIGSNIVNSIF